MLKNTRYLGSYIYCLNSFNCPCSGNRIGYCGLLNLYSFKTGCTFLIKGLSASMAAMHCYFIHR